MFESSGTKRALLMGNTYKDTGLRELEVCRRDTEKINEILIEKLCFKNENIVRKIDTYPEKEVRNFLFNVKEGDLLFIYFSGHGGELVSSINVPKKIGLMSSWINPDKSYFLSYYLDKLLSDIKITCKIILCSDTCYAGKFLCYYSGNNEVYFIGSSDVATKTSNYFAKSEEPIKYGALVLLFEYLLQYESEIIFETILEQTKNHRVKKRFLQHMTLKHIK